MSNIIFEWIWQSYFDDETKPVGSIWIGSNDFFLFVYTFKNFLICR